MHQQGKRLFINLILEFYSVTSLLISLILLVSKYIFNPLNTELNPICQ